MSILHIISMPILNIKRLIQLVSYKDMSSLGSISQQNSVSRPLLNQVLVGSIVLLYSQQMVNRYKNWQVQVRAVRREMMLNIGQEASSKSFQLLLIVPMIIGQILNKTYAEESVGLRACHQDERSINTCPKRSAKTTVILEGITVMVFQYLNLIF